jgi:exonuclease III
MNGIQNSSAELSSFLTDNDINVACLQETKLSPLSKQPSFPGYNFVRNDRLAGQGGGLAILVDHSVSFVHIDTFAFTNLDPTLELFAIRIEIGGSSLEIFNVYIPPISSCPIAYCPNFHALLDLPAHDALFFGDFNAHHPYWFSPRDPSDPRGDPLLPLSSLVCFALLIWTLPPASLTAITPVPALTSPLPQPISSSL